jgi:starch synthase
MRIVHIATELAGVAKVGGLADVLQGLSSQLIQEGHEVTIFLPKYQRIPDKDLKVIAKMKIFERGSLFENTLLEGHLGKIRLLFLKPNHPGKYFDREQIYGYEDDLLRFIYFSKCAADYLSQHAKEFDLIHLHDWHPSLIAPLARDSYPSLKEAKILLTIHNIAYQGKCRPIDLDHIGMSGGSYLSFDKLQDPTSPHLLNLLKGGIVFSNCITTVSPTYAKEILQNGYGLEKTLGFYQKKFFGILNGIDAGFWNPEEDPFLAANYAASDSLKTILKAKEKNKQALRKELRLKEGTMPLVASIGRLVTQKGPELIRHAIVHTLKKGGQFVLLGSATTPELKENFTALKEELKANTNVSFCFDFSEKLSHLLYGASDFLVVPSQFEPCGLTQMIALRYGTIPIVRKTGGLADTVFDLQESKVPEKSRNGFVFEEFSKEKLQETLDRATHLWTTSHEHLQQLMGKVMVQDYSWKHPTEKYLELYRKLMI